MIAASCLFLIAGTAQAVIMMSTPWTNGVEDGFTLANYSSGWTLLAATATNGPYYQWSWEVQPNNNWWYGGHAVGPFQKLGTVPLGAENDPSKWTVKFDSRVINMPLIGSVGRIWFQIIANGTTSTNIHVGNNTSWTTHEFTMDKMFVHTNALGAPTPFDPSAASYQVLIRFGAMDGMGWSPASPDTSPSNAFAIGLRDYTLTAIPEPAIGMIVLGGLMLLAAKRRS